MTELAYPGYRERNWDLKLKAYIDGKVAQASDDTGGALGSVAILLDSFLTDPEQSTGAADAAPAFRDALAALEAAGGGVLVTPGTGAEFWFNGVVELRSNIEIDLRGSTIRKNAESSTYACFCALSHGATGYGSGVHNVIIRNGRFRGNAENGSGLCVVAGNHLTNLLVENCEIVMGQVSGHTFDLGGCDIITIRDCRWYGAAPPGAPVAEAIQVDMSSRTATSALDDAGSYSGLMTRRVTVENCKFLPWTDPNTGTKYPCPIPIGTHAYREDQYPEHISISNIEIVDPPYDDANTGIGGDNATIRGLIHFICVRDLHVSNVRVTSTDRTGSIRVIMITGRTEGVLASSDPNASTSTQGTYANPMAPRDIFIDDLQVNGIAVSDSLNPLVSIAGATGAPARNVFVRMAADESPAEGVYLIRCEGAAVDLVDYTTTEQRAGVRLGDCVGVRVTANMREVYRPVTVELTTRHVYCNLTAVATITTVGSLITRSGSANYVTVDANASGYTNIYTAVPPNRAAGAVVGVTAN